MFAIIGGLLLVACVRSDLQQPEEPGSAAVGANQPAPSAWLTYASRHHPFTIRYPARARPDTADPSRVALLIANDSSSVAAESAFELYTESNPRRLSAGAWLRMLDSQSTSEPGPSQAQLEVSRRPMLVAGYPSLRVTERTFDADNKTIVYVPVDTLMYVLTFMQAGTEADSSSVAAYEVMLRSFTPVRTRGRMR